MNAPRVLRLPEVESRVGLKRTRIYELEHLGLFPKRRKISARACGWLESEINAFIESRPVAARKTAPTEVALGGAKYRG